MARSYPNYNNALNILESIFDSLFFVENNEDLNKIFFCFKKKKSNEEYVKLYKHNFENFRDNTEISLIENDYKRVLSKMCDMSDLKEIRNKK